MPPSNLGLSEIGKYVKTTFAATNHEQNKNVLLHSSIILKPLPCNYTPEIKTKMKHIKSNMEQISFSHATFIFDIGNKINIL
jgi:hypothetical protein